MKTPPWSGRVRRLDTVDSTNERALDAVAAGTAVHGDVFVARAQTAGRGTRGRIWSSAPGGLYLSVVLGSDVPPAPGLWTIAGALAVHDLCDRVGVRAALDWPNDVVLRATSAKLAGVLAESRGDATRYALGLGVNVHSGRVESSVSGARAVASLEDGGADVDVPTAEAMMLETIEARIAEAASDPKALFHAFFERSLLRDAPVRVLVGGRARAGRFVGLDPERGLLLASPSGAVETVPIGHVASMQPTDEAL